MITLADGLVDSLGLLLMDRFVARLDPAVALLDAAVALTDRDHAIVEG